MRTLFQTSILCPTCQSSDWLALNDNYLCQRCGYASVTSGRFISLLPERMSGNNEREREHFDFKDPHEAKVLSDYNLAKPWNYEPISRNRFLRAAQQIQRVAQGLGSNASVLFVFGGGGMEAHLSGLLGPNVVIADLSPLLLELADERFNHYDLPLPAAYIECDAERLPFADRCFDLVVGFEGVHHCLVPQAAMHEIWRVAKRRAFIVDNYECTLTNILYRIGASSRIESTGVRPSRFSKVALETMLYNQGIKRFELCPTATLPFTFAKYVKSLGRPIEWVMDFLGQGNMFTLTTYHDEKAT